MLGEDTGLHVKPGSDVLAVGLQSAKHLLGPQMLLDFCSGS